MPTAERFCGGQPTLWVALGRSFVYRVTMNQGDFISGEWLEWYLMSPQQRWRESGRMWKTFLSLGGSLEREPDTNSPFFDAEASRALPADGRSGVRVLRSSGV